MPTSVIPARSISGRRPRAARAPRREDRLGLRGARGERVRAGRPREVVEAQAQHDRAPDPAGGAHAAGDAVHEADGDRVDLAGVARRTSERALRADRAAPPARLHPARVAVVRERVQVPARPRGRASDERLLAEPATWPTVAIPRAWSFAAVTGPTPHSRSTGSGCRNASSPSGGDDQQPVRLRHPARDLRQELRPRHPDGDRQPDAVAHRRAAAARRSRPACPAMRSMPRDVEERLVDRDALDERGRCRRRRR